MSVNINGLKFQSSTWRLAKQQEHSGLGSGEFLTANLGPDLWEADLETVERPHAEIRALAAQLDALDGGAFFLGDPTAQFPAADPDGSGFGASTPTVHAIAANRKELRLAGLPDDYVLTAGDMIAIDYGSPSRRYLGRLVTGAVADGDGLTPLFEVRPHLRPGITTTLAVMILDTKAKVKIIPGSMQVRTVGALTSRISLSVRQTLGAQ